MAARLIRIALAFGLALLSPAAADPTLTPAQVRFITLATYIQVARDHCGLLIDVDVIRLAATRVAITFTSPAELKARDDGFAAAERAFAGLRRSVECAYALQRYGPEGSEFKGLTERKP